MQLLLRPTKGPGAASRPMPNGDRPAPGGWNRLVLNTPDLAAEVARLRQAGVRFRNEILLGDPSGNAVALFEPTNDMTNRQSAFRKSGNRFCDQNAQTFDLEPFPFKRFRLNGKGSSGGDLDAVA